MALKLEYKPIDELTVTRKANATLTAYRLVKADTDPANVVVCTANARPVGVCEVSAVANDVVRIICGGIVPITAGAVLSTPGTALVSDATGRVVAAGVSGDQNIVGFQLSTSGAAGDLVSVMLWPTVKYAGPTDGGVGGAVITVGAEVAHPTHSITCNIQLKDVWTADLAVVGVVHAYLSTDSAGKDINATVTPTTDLAAGTDGSLSILTAYQSYLLISEADGDIDVVLAKTDGAATVYLNIVLPSGKIITSGAITFSA